MHKSIIILIVAAILFGACGSEIGNNENDAVNAVFVALSPEQMITQPTSAAVTVSPTSVAIATPIPEVGLTPTPILHQTKEINPLDEIYWCELYEDDTDELLTPTEIAIINQKNFEEGGTGLVSLAGIERITSADVIRMIESYSFPKKNYFDNSTVTNSVKTEILRNRNIEGLKSAEFLEPSYGILINNTDLRCFPTEKPLTSSKNGRYDYFQETVLLLNEAVVVLHTSLDGEWCFVQAENYFGWISESSIAYCTREQMETWYNTMKDTENLDIILVTKNVEWQTEDAFFSMRMGTKLKYEGETDGKIMISVPTRDAENNLQPKNYSISPEDTIYQHLHRGYLSYTRSNIIRLAIGLLDTPYAWGDALPCSTVYTYDTEIGMDCSSTVGAVYRCFGFAMPRNTGAQRKMIWQGEETSNYNLSEKRELLEQKTAGTLLYTSGHVMLYLGEYEGEYYVLHNTTSEKLKDGTEEAFYRCVITSMSLGEKGKTILERLLETKTPARING